MNAPFWEDEKLREVFGTVSPDAAPTDACPSPDRLWSAVHGELEDADFREVTLHAIDCPTCTEAWRVAREVVKESGPRESAEPEPHARHGAGLGWWGLAAAAAMLALVALTLELREPSTPTGPEPAYRSDVEEPVRSLVPEGGTLARDEFVLRWEGPEGARYEVRVATEDLRVLATAEDLTEPEYRVPVERLEGLAPGSTIVWQVEAVLPDGSRWTSAGFVAELE